ncbi:bifunctional methionine sulfoxide reductase B/A protein [Shewanella sp. AS1]|uniref:bifunctional methionine sulfoxide reductase B/A protein n=1 Tax=Shewanella sp. AS1 TaxID=2907626 RepID=UPI001F48694F|nr:bifunctional methionine sulfoxide reductase B/A protein [Shewanella sp. AS1]MCE9678355.1 bifunctional methionine sulfoxide reductase B/A protein [Shewanella sp. AS1]
MRKLTEFEQYVIEDKGTEPPFSGEYYRHEARGIYHCKRCDAPLYRSEDKFNAHCGWPAFDDEIQGAVKRLPDADGRRVEIVCSQCDAHLGHVFEGEYLTEKNLRHCVNSVSLLFKSLQKDDMPISEQAQTKAKTDKATFGGGCFWCLEAIFTQVKGVLSVQSGYAGGEAQEANYKAVCSGNTGHAEVVQLEFDPQQISFRELLLIFFQSHDPTTLNRQGNDVGPQYRSVIFAHDDAQIRCVTEMLAELEQHKLYDNPVVTQLTAFEDFYPAESYHNDYYAHNSQQPYCQIVVKPKVDKFRAVFVDKLKR